MKRLGGGVGVVDRYEYEYFVDDTPSVQVCETPIV